jgi:hypothetical protein
MEYDINDGSEKANNGAIFPDSTSSQPVIAFHYNVPRNVSVQEIGKRFARKQ